MADLFRPQRARDTTEEELKELLEKNGSLYVFNKYDGVRCGVRDGVVYGKSMLPITNEDIQLTYGLPEYEGFEFEIIVTENGRYNPVTSCADTVSYTNSEKGYVPHKCIIFDNARLGFLSYALRFGLLKEALENDNYFSIPEYIEVTSMKELLTFEEKLLKEDNEGIIIRNPALEYKEGVSSKEGELLRLKRYISEEAIIVDVATSYANTNKAELNALGYTERSSKLEGKVPKEEIGKLLCKTVKDIYDPWSRRLIFRKGSNCIIAPGNMTKDEKISLYKDKENLKGKMIVFKSFPKGTKDKPRFATFQHFVPEFDQP